jgi:hypothetical protein
MKDIIFIAIGACLIVLVGWLVCVVHSTRAKLRRAQRNVESWLPKPKNRDDDTKTWPETR